MHEFLEAFFFPEIELFISNTIISFYLKREVAGEFSRNVLTRFPMEY